MKKVLVNVVCNVTAKIAHRFALKVNVHWSAMGSIVCRNVNKVPVNVTCNVAATNANRFAIKVNVH